MTPFSILRPGEPLWPADYISTRLRADHCADVMGGCYDVPVEFDKPPVILDIGANVGAFARWADKRWPNCQIFCFEPNPDNYAMLERTLMDLRGAKLNWLYPSSQAVGAKAGRQTLTEGEFNCGEWSLHTGKSGRPGIEVDVIAPTDLPKADILKIDAEGSEVDILMGLQNAGRLGESSAIMLEYHAIESGQSIADGLPLNGFVEVGRQVHSEHRGVLRFVRRDLL